MNRGSIAISAAVAGDAYHGTVYYRLHLYIRSQYRFQFVRTHVCRFWNDLSNNCLLIVHMLDVPNHFITFLLSNIIGLKRRMTDAFFRPEGVRIRCCTMYGGRKHLNISGLTPVQLEESVLKAAVCIPMTISHRLEQ